MEDKLNPRTWGSVTGGPRFRTKTGTRSMGKKKKTNPNPAQEENSVFFPHIESKPSFSSILWRAVQKSEKDQLYFMNL